MANRYLFVSDFDGTVANTFAESPNGVNVYEAYRYAIKELFGGVGLKVYEESGGLQNRAPEEIVLNMLRQDNHSAVLSKNAEKCFDKHNKTLKRLVPVGKGSPLEWVSSEDSFRNHRTMAEMLVLLKMSFLIKEIGAQYNDGASWPEPCPEFIDFYRFLEKLNENSELDIQFAILSSGHDVFIQKTFELWGLKSPEIMVTDDDMRGASYPESMDRRVKPSSYLFDLIQSQWLGKIMKEDNLARLIEQVMYCRDRMVYFGDDSVKDGELARNAKVPFLLLKNPAGELRDNPDYYKWSEIQAQISEQKAITLMKKGVEIDKIMKNLSYIKFSQRALK